MSFFKKYFAADEKGDSQPRAMNLDAQQAKITWKTLHDGSKGGKIERQKFAELFPALTPVQATFFASLAKGADKVTVEKTFALIDSLHGGVEDLADALLSVFPDPLQALKATIDVFAVRAKVSAMGSEKLLRYFTREAPKDPSRFGRWLHACPIALPLLRYIIDGFTGGMAQDSELLPRLSASSDLLNEAALAVINANLPMERRRDWTQLFSTNRQGSSFSQLSQKIDGQGPCLLVIESTDGHVFGCFASEGFCTGPQYRGNATSFLFAAHPEIQISNATGRTDNYAYMNYQQQQMPNGIGMGGYEQVWPLFVAEDFGEGLCQHHVSSFENINLCGDKQKFSIKTIEAWRCGERPKAFNAEGEEVYVNQSTKSILDKDPQARALLEMSGRKMHSEAYRDPAPLLDDVDPDLIQRKK
ncbi:unnamed protein product, partial [Mesorhabditis spiculigera]